MSEGFSPRGRGGRGGFGGGGDRGGGFRGRGMSPRGGGGGFRGGGDRGGGRGFGGRGGGDRGGFRGRGGFGDRGGRGGGRGRGSPRGGRGSPRGGGRGGMRGGRKVIIEPHRHEGVFIAKGKEDALVTKNMVVGESVYGEKRISVENENPMMQNGGAGDGDSKSSAPDKIEYRVWNPFRSKLAASIMGGLEDIHMKPGSKVLYLGAASGTTVSHVSDVVGPEGLVYAVEFSARSGRDLLNMAKKRPNIVPIVEDARRPERYRMLVGMVDCIFSDVAQPDQARIVCHNAQYYLKYGGFVVMSIKANCIDSTAEPEAVFAAEVNFLKSKQVKPREQVTLEPYERDHAVVVGEYKAPDKKNFKKEEED